MFRHHLVFILHKGFIREYCERVIRGPVDEGAKRARCAVGGMLQHYLLETEGTVFDAGGLTEEVYVNVTVWSSKEQIC